MFCRYRGYETSRIGPGTGAPPSKGGGAVRRRLLPGRGSQNGGFERKLRSPMAQDVQEWCRRIKCNSSSWPAAPLDASATSGTGEVAPARRDLPWLAERSLDRFSGGRRDLSGIWGGILPGSCWADPEGPTGVDSPEAGETGSRKERDRDRTLEEEGISSDKKKKRRKGARVSYSLTNRDSSSLPPSAGLSPPGERPQFNLAGKDAKRYPPSVLLPSAPSARDSGSTSPSCLTTKTSMQRTAYPFSAVSSGICPGLSQLYGIGVMSMTVQNLFVHFLKSTRRSLPRSSLLMHQSSIPTNKYGRTRSMGSSQTTLRRVQPTYVSASLTSSGISQHVRTCWPPSSGTRAFQWKHEVFL